MGIELYKHNQEAYEKTIKMFESKDKVAIVHPTGTGKSFISLKWLFENRHKKCLFIAPNYTIIDQLKRHIISCGLDYDKDFPNLKLQLYQGLSLMDEEEIRNENFDCIVLDEFHRCGAPEWSKGVNRLLEHNHNAKVLGLSATPIRYLDNLKDMARILFDGNIASEITLAQAIADGILPLPMYISAIYKLDQEVLDLQKIIDNETNEKIKKEAEIKLKLIKNAIQRATGLKEIFAKYITKKNGKFIVFCKDIAHMQEMMQEARNLFSLANPNIDIYSVTYQDGRKNAETKIIEFENNNNDNLKLLFSVEMLNEGLHVNNVDGVIMFRPTYSPILFMQQLGRALSTSQNIMPLIFDIVNNMRVHESIYKLKEEVEERLKENKKRNLNIENERQTELELDFQIIDEAKEIFEMIKDCKTLLGATAVDTMLDYIEEYCLRHNKIPGRKNLSPDGRSMGVAINNYRARSTILTKEQQRRVEEVDSRYGIKAKQEMMLKAIEYYCQINKRYPYAGEQQFNGRDMAAAIVIFRYGGKTFTEDQSRRFCLLEKLYGPTKLADKTNNMLTSIEKFCKKNKRYPYRGELNSFGNDMGKAIEHYRAKDLELNEEQQKRFDFLEKLYRRLPGKIGVDSMLTYIEEYCKNNNKYPTKGIKIPEPDNRDMSISIIKYRSNKIELTEEQQKRFDALEKLYSPNAKIEAMLSDIETYLKVHKKCPKEKTKSNDGRDLHGFIYNVRTGQQRLNKEQQKRFESFAVLVEGKFKEYFKIGEIKVVSREQAADTMLTFIENYCLENNRVPMYNSVAPDGRNMARAMTNYKNNKLKILNSIQQQRFSIIERIWELGKKKDSMAPEVYEELINQLKILILTSREIKTEENLNADENDETETIRPKK